MLAMCMFYSFHVEIFLLLHVGFRAPEGKSAGFVDTRELGACPAHTLQRACHSL